MNLHNYPRSNRIKSNFSARTFPTSSAALLKRYDSFSFGKVYPTETNSAQLTNDFQFA